MRRDKGFSLIELVLIIVVVGIAMPPLMMVFSEGMRKRSDSDLISTSSQLAQDLMEEIKTRKWDKNTPDEGGKATPSTTLGQDGGETRVTYDDIDDYAEIMNQSPPHDALDQPLTEFSGYTRNVDVIYVELVGDQFVEAPDTSDHKQVTVTVTSHAGSVSVVAIMSNY